ncbi:hypothetical protein CAPTEDRAFT_201205 [Capitella teleta]|uniref:Reverse transcriptase zinc-binding domain-containing protein n=1 Tax=Capitella teleta TaxID=283909 RepID=R7V4K8_CAPTE|nr:hypothetical protein CAPTEDRAFT_201205 [Capitella teleta]|eukprot:ELU13778.1 hypothetical protein CAPTEDRAFT_201205 [Capitella teleta]
MCKIQDIGGRPSEREREINKIRSSTRTKYQTYILKMNPELERHAMYDNNISELHRRSTARFRLFLHNLAIERGRWTRKPAEQRLCSSCGVVQDEQHALRDFCINSDERQHLMTQRPLNLMLPTFFNDEDIAVMTKFCHVFTKKFM